MLETRPLCEQLCLGRQGENLARIVYFKEPELWKKKFGEGECKLLHKRNGDEAPYPVNLEVVDGKYGWKITDVDTSVVGLGECELIYSVCGVVVKSKVMPTYVQPSLSGDVVEPPEPYKPWVDQVIEAAEKVEDATTHQPIIGDNGNWFVWDAETSKYKDTGTSASGGGSADLDDIPERVEKLETPANVTIRDASLSEFEISGYGFAVNDNTISFSLSSGNAFIVHKGWTNFHLSVNATMLDMVRVYVDGVLAEKYRGYRYTGEVKEKIEIYYDGLEVPVSYEFRTLQVKEIKGGILSDADYEKLVNTYSSSEVDNKIAEAFGTVEAVFDEVHEYAESLGGDEA